MQAEGFIVTLSIILSFASFPISCVAHHVLLEHSDSVPSYCASCCCLPLKSHILCVLLTFVDVNLMDMKNCIWLIFLQRRKKQRKKKKRRGKKISLCVHNNCQPVLSALSVSYLPAVCIYTLLSLLHLSSSLLKNCLVVSNILLLDRT